jgi:hypothetical protein
MRFHSQWFGVVASSRDNIEKEERLPTCLCLRVDILTHLVTAVVFDGDLHDGIIVAKKESACRPRPALRIDVQLPHTLLGLEIDIVPESQGPILVAPVLNLLKLLFITISLYGMKKNLWHHPQ